MIIHFGILMVLIYTSYKATLIDPTDNSIYIQRLYNYNLPILQ